MRLKFEELAEGRQRSRPWRNSNSSKHRKKTHMKLRRAQQPSDRLENRSGPLNSSCPGGAQKKRTGEEDRQPSDLEKKSRSR
jgi:hypothetical protein